MTRFLTLLILVGTLVFRPMRVAELFARLRLARLTLAGWAFRRTVLAFLRVVRRTVRAAGLATFPERAFFVFIPGCDPFGGCRILSDVPETTGPARLVQWKFPCQHYPRGAILSAKR